VVGTAEKGCREGQSLASSRLLHICSAPRGAARHRNRRTGTSDLTRPVQLCLSTLDQVRKSPWLISLYYSYYSRWLLLVAAVLLVAGSLSRTLRFLIVQ
jgi:hypothetical protein